ncbi:hypothetical protein C2845_PM10G11300 [Panicum miliaceum]|uniref:Uncharacterized protein n=1 Tax=Panicum miliaceum TaxID=4540 RepID=A0A3L6PF84_PANMI|nr:hypothetical protein C2845_PM10G11300 [Panicum miliaceum]
MAAGGNRGPTRNLVGGGARERGESGWLNAHQLAELWRELKTAEQLQMGESTENRRHGKYDSYKNKSKPFDKKKKNHKKEDFKKKKKYMEEYCKQTAFAATLSDNDNSTTSDDTSSNSSSRDEEIVASRRRHAQFKIDLENAAKEIELLKVAKSELDELRSAQSGKAKSEADECSECAAHMLD